MIDSSVVPLDAALADTPAQPVESAAHLTAAGAGIDVNGDASVDAFDVPALLSRLFD